MRLRDAAEILSHVNRTPRSLLVFLIQQLSRLLVWSERRYFVAGSVLPEHTAEFERRLLYYLGGTPSSVVAWRCGREYQVRRLSLEGASLAGKLNPLQVLWWFLTAKILVARQSPWASRLDRLLRYKVFLVDWRGTFRFSAWRWTSAVGTETYAQAKDRWQSLQGHGDTVVLMGTGPSAEMVFDEPYASLPVIICNTAVKSARLRKQRIAGICIADALYFIAPTPYAQAFHAALREAITESDFPVFAPVDHLPFYYRRCPWIPRERLIGIWHHTHAAPNANLKAAPIQRNACSVFPMMMLPVAATLYKRILLIGFDGKDPNLKNYFWKHNPQFQFPELLPSVKEHDCGFFSGCDEKWYQGHNQLYSDEIEQMLREVEGRGVKVAMAHRSFIPCLQARFAARSGVEGRPGESA